MKKYKVFLEIEASNINELSEKLDILVNKEIDSENTVSGLFKISKY